MTAHRWPSNSPTWDARPCPRGRRHGPDVLPEGLAARSRATPRRPGLKESKAANDRSCGSPSRSRSGPACGHGRPRRGPTAGSGPASDAATGPGCRRGPIRPGASRSPERDQRRAPPANRRPSRRARTKTTSPGSSSPTTSSSGSRRPELRSPRVSPRRPSNTLRLAQNVVRSATNVPESARNGAGSADPGPDAQSPSATRSGSSRERAERQRLAAAAEQRTRAVDQFMANQQTIKAMMNQFDLLMGEGVYNTLYNGGMGNISAGDRALLPGPHPRPAGPVAHAQGHAALQRRRPRPLRRHVRLAAPWASSSRRCSSRP